MNLRTAKGLSLEEFHLRTGKISSIYIKKGSPIARTGAGSPGKGTGSALRNRGCGTEIWPLKNFCKKANIFRESIDNLTKEVYLYT